LVAGTVVVVVVKDDVPGATGAALASGVAGGVADAAGAAARAVVSVVVVSVFFSQPARAVAARATAVSRRRVPSKTYVVLQG